MLPDLKPITVDITQEDIDNGKRCQAALCPVARGLNRASGISWSVSAKYAVALDGRECLLPTEVRDFVAEFDAAGQVAPFSFQVRPYLVDVPLTLEADELTL